MPPFPYSANSQFSGGSGYAGVPNLGPDYSNALRQMQERNNQFYSSGVQPLMSPTITAERFGPLAQILAGQTGQYSAGLGEFGGAAAARQGSAASQLLSSLEQQRLAQLMQAQGLYGQMQGDYSRFMGEGQNRADQFYRGNQMMDFQQQQAGKQETMDWVKTAIAALPALIQMYQMTPWGKK